jgi:hypothetical protein
MFLRETDFLRAIQRENLDVITGEDQTLLNETILAAQSEMESYLRHRYDVAKIFIDLNAYDSGTTYAQNAVVAYPDIEDQIYKCISTTNIVGIDPTDSTKWSKGDPRNPLIKMHLIDLTLYHLHSRINPRNIPEFRIQRRDDAIKWMEMVAKSLISTDLPTLAVPDENIGKNIIFGQTKTNQLY